MNYIICVIISLIVGLLFGIPIGGIIETHRMEKVIRQLKEFLNGKHDDCLKEDALIKTQQGYKFVKDIVVGDMVYTHKNGYMPVKKL